MPVTNPRDAAAAYTLLEDEVQGTTQGADTAVHQQNSTVTIGSSDRKKKGAGGNKGEKYYVDVMDDSDEGIKYRTPMDKAFMWVSGIGLLGMFVLLGFGIAKDEMWLMGPAATWIFLFAFCLAMTCKGTGRKPVSELKKEALAQSH